MPRAKRTTVPPANSQQQFGFHDRETATPAHDELTVWLHKNCQPMFQHLFGGPFSPFRVNHVWTQVRERIEKYRPEWQRDLLEVEKAKLALRDREALRDYTIADYERTVKDEPRRRAMLAHGEAPPPAPDRPPVTTRLHLERPIMRPGSSFMVGVADAVVYFKSHELSFNDEGYARGSYSPPRTPFEWKVNEVSRTAIVELKPKIISLGELLRQVNVYGSAMPDAHIVVVSPDEQYREIIEDQDVRFVAPREITGGA